MGQSGAAVSEGLIAFLSDLKGAISKLEGSLAGHTATTPSNVSGAEAGIAAASASTEEQPLSPAVKDFDALISDLVEPWLNASQTIGEPLSIQTAAVGKLFAAQRSLILAAGQSKKPSFTSPEFAEALKPLSAGMGSISQIKDDNRRSKLYNLLSTVAEGVPALGWVAIEKTPAPFVNDMKDSAQFWGNRVIKDSKDKEPTHAEWAKQFIAILTELNKYVKQHHTTGLAFSAKSQQDLKTSLANAAGPSATAAATPGPAPAGGAGPPPPPPPPGSPPPPFLGDAAPASSGPDMNAVFADLNRGENVTSGLKKVDKSQMTHKNPALRATSVVSDKSPAKQSTSAKAASATAKPARPARTELEGTKWFVENYDSASTPIVLDGVELNHSVYVSNCKRSTLQIKGKFNALTLESCDKLGVVVDSLVSSIDLVKCKSFAIQIEGQCPTVICDSCDGGSIYLSDDARACEIMTAKTGGVNVYVLEGQSDAKEFTEQPLPEMVKHVIDPATNKIVSTFVEYKD
ncbi:suppressor of rasval19 [Savitreella phatthalungensis]